MQRRDLLVCGKEISRLVLGKEGTATAVVLSRGYRGQPEALNTEVDATAGQRVAPARLVVTHSR